MINYINNNKGKNMNKTKTKILLFVASLVLFSLGTSFAFAQAETVGDIARAISNPLKRLDVLFIVFCYVSGLILTIIGCFKLKEHSDSKGQTKLATCLLYIIAGTCLLSIGGVLQIGSEIMGVAGDDSMYVEDSKLKY